MPMPGVPAVRHHREEDWLQACVETQQDVLVSVSPSNARRQTELVSLSIIFGEDSS